MYSVVVGEFCKKNSIKLFKKLDIRPCSVAIKDQAPVHEAIWGLREDHGFRPDKRFDSDVSEKHLNGDLRNYCTDCRTLSELLSQGR
mmetsp:Transcript_92070/g.159778  ORF Transcript_92070/g.159778 Transcript_92070/m.159778 type:complete len:87 (-) Transcript_92070:1044-1304(-)